MGDVLKLYEGRPLELKAYLAEQRATGFPDLSSQHRQFCYEYVANYDIYEAADSADIGRTAARRTFAMPMVQEFIQYLNEEKQHYSLISAAFVEAQYLNLYGKLIGAEEINMIVDGSQICGKKFHGSEAVAALRDMAKSTGFYKEEPKANVSVSVSVNDVKLTNEQKAILDKALDSSY